MKPSVVIGANFGDEGKGLITDYLASKAPFDTLVVRFNGGAQAAHTVHTPEGKTHVFRHIGAGHFTGAVTLLAREFVVNPIIFKEEREKLLLFDEHIRIHPMIDLNCRITTPWDMMINQALEKKRGDTKHGSCGLGFHETIMRHKQKGSGLRMRDLYEIESSTLLGRLREIRDVYAPIRMHAIGLETDDIPHLKEDRILIQFYDDLDYFRMHTHCLIDSMAIHEHYSQNLPIVFEGAQGLQLHQNRGHFPHVTHSRTGLENVSALLNDADIYEAEVYYVSRCYGHRHGRGPLNTEVHSDLPYKKVSDPTNPENQFQGKMRYGWLNRGDMIDAIKADLESVANSPVQFTPKFALTCLDQLDEDEIYFIDKGVGCSLFAPVDKFMSETCDLIGAKSGLMSYGKTRTTILNYEKPKLDCDLPANDRSL